MSARTFILLDFTYGSLNALTHIWLQMKKKNHNLCTTVKTLHLLITNAEFVFFFCLVCFSQRWVLSIKRAAFKCLMKQLWMREKFLFTGSPLMGHVFINVCACCVIVGLSDLFFSLYELYEC